MNEDTEGLCCRDRCTYNLNPPMKTQGGRCGGGGGGSAGALKQIELHQGNGGRPMEDKRREIGPYITGALQLD